MVNEVIINKKTVAPYQFVLSSANDETCLVGACSRRTLFYLQSTLNHSYGGDYDFSNVQSDEFSHEPSVCWVKNFIDSTLTAALSSQYTPQIKNQVSLKSGLKKSENFKLTWNLFCNLFLALDFTRKRNNTSRLRDIFIQSRKRTK